MENDVAAIAAELRNMGREHGLCAPWREMLSDAGDKETLVKMYLRGIDFCLAYDYPRVEYMERNFKGMCEPFGVFVSELVRAHNVPKVVAVGESTGMAEYEGAQVARVFVKHQSRITVIAAGASIVSVDCFDRSEIHVLAKAGAEITVYRYGDALVDVWGGNVSVIHKNCTTYE